MVEKDILNLELNTLVMAKCSEPVDGHYVGTIKSINLWTRRVGVVDVNGSYKEYPYRLLKEYPKN